jgi:hypothetical protein
MYIVKCVFKRNLSDISIPHTHFIVEKLVAVAFLRGIIQDFGVTRLRAARSEVRVPAREINFYRLQNVQTGFGGLSLREKWAGLACV